MDANCCAPTKLNQEEMKWLPMQIFDSSGLHYVPYDEAKILKKADERDRRETNQPKNVKNALASSTLVEKESVDLTATIPMTAQKCKSGGLLCRI